MDYDAAWEGGTTLRHVMHQGFEFQGKWGSSGWMWLAHERERVGAALLARRAVGFDITAVPARWMPRLHLDGDVGQRIDYAGARVGNGGMVNFGTSMRASDHLELQLTTTREWLDDVFSANIDWLKMTYTFSRRTLVRVIAQQSEVDRSALPRDRSLSFSGLYAYKLNWQTVFFVGFGDSRITGDGGALVQQPRSVFMKVAYALQR